MSFDPADPVSFVCQCPAGMLGDGKNVSYGGTGCYNGPCDEGRNDCLSAATCKPHGDVWNAIDSGVPYTCTCPTGWV